MRYTECVQHIRRIAFLSLIAGFLTLGALALRPVPIVVESECKVVTGRITDVLKENENDVVFLLEDERRRFYINRGLEHGLQLESLRRDWIAEDVTIKYPRYWTPLDPTNSSRHVSKLEAGGIVLFDETR